MFSLKSYLALKSTRFIYCFIVHLRSPRFAEGAPAEKIRTHNCHITKRKKKQICPKILIKFCNFMYICENIFCENSIY